MPTGSGQPLNLDLTRLEDGQLATLVKTVHEARFPDEEDDPVVWLGPFVIDLHVAAIGEQRDRRLRSFAARASRGEDVEDEVERYEQSYAFWAGWQGRRHEQDVVKRRIDSDVDTRRRFSRLTPEDVRPLFRPFEMDDESAEDVIAYARRSAPYEPEAAGSADDAPRPYARPLTSVERPHGWVDVHEVAVLRPASSVLSDHEATSRPEDVLRRLGFGERDARDCAQNAWKAIRTGFQGWCGVLPDDTLPDD